MKAWRKDRRRLIQFLDLVLMQVRAGFDLAYAWREAAEGELPMPAEGAAFPDFLACVAENPRWAPARVWLVLLATQYRQGVALAPVLSAATQALRREERAELRSFSERLQTQVQVLLLVFCLLPALWVLVAPLLLKLYSISNT